MEIVHIDKDGLNELRDYCNSIGISCRDKSGSLLTPQQLIKRLNKQQKSSSTKVLLGQQHQQQQDIGDHSFDGDKSELINELYGIFRQYPDVFPDAYFRFLKADLDETIKKGTFEYGNGLLITWKQYKRSGSIKGKVDYVAGDFLLDKMVTLNPGNGMAQEYMTNFLKNVVKKGTCYLKVAADNTRAIRFYEKNGFKKVADIEFGSIPGIVMKYSGN